MVTPTTDLHLAASVFNTSDPRALALAGIVIILCYYALADWYPASPSCSCHAYVGRVTPGFAFDVHVAAINSVALRSIQW